MYRLLQRFWCAFWRGHGFYFEDIKRIDEVMVTGTCFKCRTKFTAFCGLDLPGHLHGYRSRSGAK